MQIVGRKYADEPQRARGTALINNRVHDYTVRVHPRPVGMLHGVGVQAYSYTQLADFLKLLQLPFSQSTNSYPKLLPGLRGLTLDLVNFNEHGPSGVNSLEALINWQVGPVVDDLVVTGLPDSAVPIGEDNALKKLLRTEGLLSMSDEFSFLPTKVGLKACEIENYIHEIVPPHRRFVRRQTSQTYPAGGEPPKSHSGRATIWKFCRLTPPHEWIEFSRKTGRPTKQIRN